MSGSLEFLGGRRMMDESGGLNPSAVAGSPSVTRLTKRSWTGMSASGIPRRTVKKILHTHETRQCSPSDQVRE
jgi:hypothetical protein